MRTKFHNDVPLLKLSKVTTEFPLSINDFATTEIIKPAKPETKYFFIFNIYKIKII